MDKTNHPSWLQKIDCMTPRMATQAPRKPVYFPETIHARLRRGWSLDNALDYPVVVAEVQQ